MKIFHISFFSALAVLFSFCIASSCSRSERFAGVWQGNPERVDVPGASNASAVVTIDFAPTDAKAGSGQVNISAVIELQQPVTSAGFINEPYETSVAATASVTGRYIADDNDDDDIILSFNPSTFQVNVDRNGVTFSQNVLSGTPDAQLDSLTSATAERWRLALTPVIRDLFNRYSTIDDIEVHHNDILRFELGKTDYIYNRVGVPD